MNVVLRRKPCHTQVLLSLAVVAWETFVAREADLRRRLGVFESRQRASQAGQALRSWRQVSKGLCDRCSSIRRQLLSLACLLHCQPLQKHGHTGWKECPGLTKFLSPYLPSSLLLCPLFLLMAPPRPCHFNPLTRATAAQKEGRGRSLSRGHSKGAYRLCYTPGPDASKVPCSLVRPLLTNAPCGQFRPLALQSVQRATTWGFWLSPEGCTKAVAGRRSLQSTLLPQLQWLPHFGHGGTQVGGNNVLGGQGDWPSGC